MESVVVILCHPSPTSFNAAVAKRVVAGLQAARYEVHFHDLYAEGFDPVLGLSELRRRFSLEELIQRHYHDLEAALGLVIVHPEWWNQPPAMLKGWVDRVLGPGIGYEFEGEEFMTKHKVPLLGGKRALVLATTDAPDEPRGRGEGAAEPLLAQVWRETLHYCGIDDFHFSILADMHNLDSADRREWLDAVGELIEVQFPPLPD